MNWFDEEYIAAVERMRKDALHTDARRFTVDTCETPYCGWETAIWTKDSETVIVEYYEDKALAIEGHKKWSMICSNTVKSLKLMSVQNRMWYKL